MNKASPKLLMPCTPCRCQHSSNTNYGSRPNFPPIMLISTLPPITFANQAVDCGVSPCFLHPNPTTNIAKQTPRRTWGWPQGNLIGTAYIWNSAKAEEITDHNLEGFDGLFRMEKWERIVGECSCDGLPAQRSADPQAKFWTRLALGWMKWSGNFPSGKAHLMVLCRQDLRESRDERKSLGHREDSTRAQNLGSMSETAWRSRGNVRLRFERWKFYWQAQPRGVTNEAYQLWRNSCSKITYALGNWGLGLLKFRTSKTTSFY